jgi:hypothetical protein
MTEKAREAALTRLRRLLSHDLEPDDEGGNSDVLDEVDAIIVKYGLQADQATLEEILDILMAKGCFRQAELFAERHSM